MKGQKTGHFTCLLNIVKLNFKDGAKKVKEKRKGKSQVKSVQADIQIFDRQLKAKRCLACFINGLKQMLQVEAKGS